MSLTDNTLATANNLGTLSGSINISDVIGGTDPVSYYKFTLSENNDIAGTVDWGVRSGTPPFLRLVVDFNGNGFVEDNERIDTFSAGGDTSFFQSLPTGTYYLEVTTGNFLTRDYSIQLGATPKPGNVSPDPGATFGQAFDLGTLSAQRVLRDYVSNAIDPVDTYKFTLSQKTNIGVLINGTTQNLRLYFAADTNGNGVYDADETLTTFSGGSNTTSSVILEPGTYFLQAAPPRTSTFTYATHYELTLNPVPDFSGDDTILGTPGGDTLNGFAGNDRLIGLTGSDLLLGDAGNDTVLGGAGNDVMDGGIDNDRLEGGTGSDRLIGFTGSDILLGGAGNDTVLGGAGNDVMNGSIGNDRIVGGAGRDSIITGSGRDTIVIGRREGVDIVRDFSDRRDRIDLAGRLSFGQLTIRQSGRNALVGAGGSTLLVLQNVSANVLTRSDFI
jgi:Ca2+-binding RTX toxin-like protein